MNTGLQRVINVVDWLIFEKRIENRRQLASALGYTESSLSQILNGKVHLSERFIKKLSTMDKSISQTWLLTGEGQMLKGGNNYEDNSEIDTIPNSGQNPQNLDEMNYAIVELSKVITMQSSQINRLIDQVEKSGDRADRMLDIIEKREGIERPSKKRNIG